MITISQNNKIAFSCAIVVFFILSSCCHTDEPVPPTLGKRNYTWTLDTLSYPGSFQTLMRSIWASSANDVYVVGHNDQNRGQMYHYEGTKWTAVHLAQTDGGYLSDAFELSAIYGFGSLEVFAVGRKIWSNQIPPPNFLDSSMIIRYDGTGWREDSIIKGSPLYTIWGANKSDIWAGGDHGTLYHFNGNIWNKVQFDNSKFFNKISGFTSDDIYATCGKGTVPDTGGIKTYFLYHWNGMTWDSLDSFYSLDPSWKFGLRLWTTENHNLYSATYGVYHYEGANRWTQLLDNDWPLFLGGSSNNNIFAIGTLGRIFHWNGIDWKRFTEIEYLQIIWYDVWTNNVETFIVGNDGRQTYILHGK